MIYLNYVFRMEKLLNFRSDIDRKVSVGVNHIDHPQTFEIVRYQIMLLQTVRIVDDISRLKATKRTYIASTCHAQSTFNTTRG